MVDIVTRLGKGSPLTNAEVDANFTNLAEVSGVTGEPMGHEDRTTSTISFNASTRTFTIAPTASSFTVWCKGKKVVVSSARTVTIPNTTGMYSIYFDSTGTLAAKSGYFTFAEEAPTAYIYWNATTGTAPYFGDERHGVVLDWQTHEYLHRTRGAALASGFSASGYALGGSGSLNSHAQLTLEGGTFFDEDMKIIVTATNTPTAGTWEQDLLSPARIPVLYLSGTAWVIDAPTDYPLKQGTARPQYNAFSGGVWSTADVANNKYATSWILATNNLTYPVIAIIGQAESDLQSAAEAVDFTALQLPGFPSVEFRPLYKLIFQCADSCTNAVHASLVSITDIRSIVAAGTAASIVTDHGNLSGLSDDDHPQYLSVDTVRSGLTAAVKASFLPSQTGNAGKFLTTDATSTSWAALTSGNITTALGFTPYNATNPAGYITGITSGNVTTALGFTPYNATNPSGFVTAAGARGAISVTGAGSYDSATGVINIVGGVTSFNTRTGAITLSSADVTTALGFTPYNSTNPNGYLTGITSTQVTTALGYTPYNSSNPSGYITGITSGMVTTALGFTPYNNSNPSGYITNSALSGYLTSASAASTYLPLSGGSLTGPLAITGSVLTTTAASSWGVYSNTNGANYSGIWFSTNVGELLLRKADGTLSTRIAADGSFAFINGNNILHAANYNSYSPTLTGTGASGTWGISITGNAATATSASSAATAANVASGEISNLNTAWTAPGTSIGNGFRVYRYQVGATGQPESVDNANWLINIYSHPSGGTASYGHQLSGTDTENIWMRTVNNGGFGTWRVLIHSGNYNSYSPTLTGGGASGTWSINITGTAATATSAPNYLPLSGGSLSGPLTITGNATYVGNYGYSTLVLQDSGGYPGLNYRSGSSNWLVRMNAGGSTMIWAYSSNASSQGVGGYNQYLFLDPDQLNHSSSIRAPIFYDSNNTGYYLDPNSNSVLTTATFNLNESSLLSLTTAGTNASMIKAGSGDELYVGGNNTWQMRFSGANVLMDNGGYLLNGESIRSPIFYDSDNTGYYVNPTSTSNFIGLTVANTISGSVSGSAGSAGSVPWTGVSSGTRTNYDLGFQPPVSGFSGFYFSKSTSGSTASDAGYLLIRGTSDSFPPYTAEGITLVSDANSLNLFARGSSLVSGGNAWVRMGTSSGETFRLMSDYSLSINSSRAPIFYDSDDTSYYTSPNGNSRLYSLGLGGATPDTRLSISGDSHFVGILHLGGTAGSVGSWGSRDYTTSGNRYFNANSYNFDNYGYGSNWSFTLSGGIGQASASLRAPIFYDSDNTGYYVDPAGSSVSASLNGPIVMASTGWTGEVPGKIQYHSSSWYLQYSSYFHFRRADGGNTFYGDNGGNTWSLGSSRAPIFYDSDNTGYYVDPASTSVLQNIIAGGGVATNGWGSSSPNETVRAIPKGGAASFDGGPVGAIKIRLPQRANNTMWRMTVKIYNYDSDSISEYSVGSYSYSTGAYNYGAYFTGSGNATPRTVRVGNDGSYDCVWIGETDTTWSYPVIAVTDFVGGFRNGNSATWISNWDVSIVSSFTGTQSVATPNTKFLSVTATSAMYAPIFYDSNNTGFYSDPASTSRMSNINYDNLYFSADTTYGLIGRNGYLDTINGRGSDPLELNYYDGGTVIIGSGASKSLLANGLYANIFYEKDNTGYYFDPASVSYLYGLTLAGGSYFRPNNWIQQDSAAGIYWPNHYGAHLEPNVSSTYTQIKFRGGKNSYGGIYDEYSAVNGFMYDSAGNGGVYREGNGRWYFYYNLSNDCMGVGTSSTSSTYSLYLNKGVYAQSRIDATIFYDTNNTTYYVDPNDTGVSVRVAGNVTAYYSDMRLKTHLGKIENARDKVRQLEGFYYEANELAQSFGYKAKREVGVSAQAVQAVLPEIVTDAPINSNYLTIDYERLTPLLIEAIKEQDTELVDLRNRVAQLESLIHKLIGD